MNTLNIEPMRFENAGISLEDDNGRLSLIITGDIDMRDTSVDFLPYLLKVHEAIIKNGIKNITVNILGLTFMNSNGIKSIINWIMKITEQPEANRYKIYFEANTDIAWQDSTLPVLKKLFPDHIVINQD